MPSWTDILPSRQHSLLAGLTADDHTQYLLLAGRSGGQTEQGGTASGDKLTLQSTSHATKGGIVLGKGRDGLARAAGGGPEGCKKPADGSLATKTNGASVAWNGWTHIMADHVITPTATGATGRVYLIMLNVDGPNTISRDGGYEDVYVKTAKGWRIQQRTHVRTRAWHNPKLQTPDLN